MISIGDLRLCVRSAVPLMDIDNAAYRPFLDEPRVTGGARADIQITVVAEPGPADASPLVFDNAGVWTVQGHPGGYRVSFYKTEDPRPHTVVCSDYMTTQVRLYLDQEVLPSKPSAEGLWNPMRYPVDQVLLMNHLAPREGAIVHAAGAVVGGKALALLGVSGAGKSTITRLLMGAGLCDSLLSDDRLILRPGRGSEGVSKRKGGGMMAWGTPWAGDACVARNAGAPLAALVFLVQAGENALVPIDEGTAMRKLLRVVSGPWYQQEWGDQVMNTCARLVEEYPCFDLRFRRDQDVAELIADNMWHTSPKR